MTRKRLRDRKRKIEMGRIYRVALFLSAFQSSIPQESVLGPVLFCVLYDNGILSKIKKVADDIRERKKI